MILWAVMKVLRSRKLKALADDVDKLRHLVPHDRGAEVDAIARKLRDLA